MRKSRISGGYYKQLEVLELQLQQLEVLQLQQLEQLLLELDHESGVVAAGSNPRSMMSSTSKVSVSSWCNSSFKSFFKVFFGSSKSIVRLL